MVNVLKARPAEQALKCPLRLAILEIDHLLRISQMLLRLGHTLLKNLRLT